MGGESSSDDDAGGSPQSGRWASAHNELSGRVEAENVVQAGHIGAVHIYPRPRSSVRVPAQLPPAVGGFVDRRVETSRFHEIVGGAPDLARPAVALVSGMRGVGKSAAAIRWAHELRARCDDGQLYADLGALARRGAVETADVLRIFLRALGVNVDIDGDDVLRVEALTALFRDHTSGRRLLIVLEDVPYASNISPLIPASEHSVVVVTSQYRLKGLLHDGAELLTLKPLTDDDGVDLLARMLGRPRLDAEADAARQVVRYCGGLPLALRMVGARLKARTSLRLAAVARAMADERGRLTMLADDEQAIEAAFTVAYDGLPNDTRALYRWLGLHPGREVSVEIVVAATGISLDIVERHLDVLVAANLLADVGDGERYSCHELVWLHARRCGELVDDEDERDAAFDRLARTYLRQAVRADHAVMGPRLRLADHPWFTADPSPFTSAAEALDWLETERRNLLDVVREAARRGRDSMVWWMCEALWALYLNRKHYAEWVESHELAVVATVRLGDPAGEARMRSQLARARMELGQHDGALAELAAATEATRRAGNRRLEASVLEFTGRVLIDQGTDHAAGEAALTAAVSLNTEIGNKRGAAIAMHHLGRAHRQCGRLDDAVSVLRQALAVFEGLTDDYNQGRVLISLGEALRDQEDYDEAARTLDRAAEIMRRRGALFQVAQALEALAELGRLTGDADSEQRHLRPALTIYDSLGSPRAARLREKIGTVDG
jgi:tetratricopeptide (TPR) repeat protein